MHRLMQLVLVLIAVAGCHGPIGAPLVQRLTDEEQEAVDAAWRNMVTPPDRPEAELLLDAVILGQLHNRGVDLLRFESQKQVDDGVVVMEVEFDRQQPDRDLFRIAHFDRRGHEQWREEYSFAQVEDRIQYWCEIAVEPEALTLEELEAAEARAAEREARLASVSTLLQPMMEPPEAGLQSGEGEGAGAREDGASGQRPRSSR